VGERLTGWVAARRPPIINSDATLDLGARVDAATPPLLRCLGVPLLVGDVLVAVLTLYTSAPEGFSERRRPAGSDRGASPTGRSRERRVRSSQIN
jgi:GAF domain-containing protein